jgi:hypothetical protein
MSHCLQNHIACNETSKVPWYPTRLLCVAPDQTAKGQIRLVCTADQQLDGPYVTLSHCWGKLQITKLLRSNIDDFRSGIPLTGLPKTFRDAVVITQRLGISWLWIDSLCIIQDQHDFSDWGAEAALMNKVYSHSYCNIAASAAEDGSQGLFFPRDPRDLQIVEVDLCVRDLKSDVDSDVEHIRYRIVNSHFWAQNVTESVLNTRAWVLQERLLSPRVLHFGCNQLLWECREWEAAESYPNGVPAILSSYPDGAMKYEYCQNANWGEIVKTYSTTSLTFASDKLAAVSALAKQMKDSLNDEYIAGLWRTPLVTQLLWRISSDWRLRDMSPPTRPAQYRAPTCTYAFRK